MAIIGEEGGNGKKSSHVWVCDPLDGTFPFTYRLPLSVFSLALVEEGRPIVGIIYDPFTDRLYTAEKGMGARVNGALAKVSSKKLGPDASIMMEWWGRCTYDVDTAMHVLSADTGTYVLHLGSTVQSGCMVIRGVSEANVFPGTKGKFVDAAAMKIIVEEAGGRVTDLTGSDQRYDTDINGIVLSNGIVHDEVLAYIKKYSLTRI
jgi:fructose-1,6-bisphosphatase/inositol monophosphatase family enzyme